MRICVVGTGYVGLVAGAGFAEFGNDVFCADIDEGKIARLLKRGEIPIYEPGLETLVQRNAAEERLRFTTDVGRAVSDVDAVFIAVGTPPGADGSADLSHVWDVARTVGQHATGFTVVVTKSTVPVGTGDRVMQILQEAGPGKDFAVVSNPEFLKEGDAVNDFMKPQRVVVGADDERAAEVMRQLYRPFVRTRDRLLLMDVRSAEVTKYACNAMLATRISFMNEMAALCDQVGANVAKVRQGMAWDDRIGHALPLPRRGLRRLLLPQGRQGDHRHGPGRAACGCRSSRRWRRSTRRRSALLADRGRWPTSAATPRARPWRCGAWPSSPQTDDVREAPAVTIADMLLDAGASLRLHDPGGPRDLQGAELPPSDRVIYCERNYEAAEGADALLPGHRVAGLPLPRLQAAQGADAGRRALRRAQHLGPRDRTRAGVYVRVHRAPLIRLQLASTSSQWS